MTSFLDVLESAAAFVNRAAPEGKKLSPSELKPFLSMAQRDVVRALASRGVSSVRQRRELAAPLSAASTLVSLMSTPALPEGLVKPLALWERAFPEGGAWRAVERVRSLPVEIPPERHRRIFELRGDALVLPAATGETALLVEYMGSLGRFEAPRDEIAILDAADPIALLAAHYALVSTSPSAAAALRAQAKEQLFSLANLSARREQSRPVRRLHPRWRGLARKGGTTR